MIFWNALPRTALYTHVACVINKREQGDDPGETVEQTPLRAVPAPASTHTSYGQKTSPAEPELAEKIFAGYHAKNFRKICAEKVDAGSTAMGERDARENVGRRKDRPTAIRDVSRDIYFSGFGRVSADAALRK